MTSCNCKDHVPKTQVLDMIEEQAKEIEEVVTEFISQENQKKEDSLALIFQKQKELLDYLNESKPNNYYSGPERYPFEKVMHMMTAMSDEFSEVRAGLNWKYWKSYHEYEGEDDSAPNLPQNFLDLPDLEATQEQIIANSKLQYLQNEWIDILHFWVQGAQELGLDSKKTLELYLDKNKENHARQDQGY